MSFSPFLESRRENVRKLVSALEQDYPYVSVLGVDTKSKNVQVTSQTSAITPGGETECGFVVKVNAGGVFFEYSLDDVDGDISALANTLRESFRVPKELNTSVLSGVQPELSPMKQSFCRPSDLVGYTDEELLHFCREQKDALLQKSGSILNAACALRMEEISKLFVSNTRELDQNYAWVNGILMVVYRENGKTVRSVASENHECLAPVLKNLPEKADALLEKAHCLTLATPIEPGVYDVITDPSITGLIAHEAFGHGVEMDQFVKDRALAKSYVGDYVASPICNMRDGAASTLSAASYFFDDDGVLAGDTQIIKDGILAAGISDLVSANELGTVPTGNGRRQSSRRKAYSRMTNTFFQPGKDKLEDMIASISHGYMLFETNNGMEDPKNWAIQCVANYGIEIVDGKLTDHYVSPVVMSGYVPDLLKSISMISDTMAIEGIGSCGKGYKEWVHVSDGGPALKARVKLG